MYGYNEGQGFCRQKTVLLLALSQKSVSDTLERQSSFADKRRFYFSALSQKSVSDTHVYLVKRRVAGRRMHRLQLQLQQQQQLTLTHSEREWAGGGRATAIALLDIKCSAKKLYVQYRHKHVHLITSLSHLPHESKSNCCNLEKSISIVCMSMDIFLFFLALIVQMNKARKNI